MAKLLKPLAVAGLMVASMTTLAAQPPRLKMTTDIPASITAPDKVDTSIGTLNYFDGVPTGDTVDNRVRLSRPLAGGECLPELHPGTLHVHAEGRAGEGRMREQATRSASGIP